MFLSSNLFRENNINQLQQRHQDNNHPKVSLQWQIYFKYQLFNFKLAPLETYMLSIISHILDVTQQSWFVMDGFRWEFIYGPISLSFCACVHRLQENSVLCYVSIPCQFSFLDIWHYYIIKGPTGIWPCSTHINWSRAPCGIVEVSDQLRHARGSKCIFIWINKTYPVFGPFWKVEIIWFEKAKRTEEAHWRSLVKICVLVNCTCRP